MLRAAQLTLLCLLSLSLAACGDVEPTLEPLPGAQLVLDDRFGTAGQVRTSLTQYDEIYAAALQLNGKIVVAGSVTGEGNTTSFGLVRYLSDGSLDPTFGEGGSVVTNLKPPGGVYLAIPYFLLVQADGKFIVGGMQAEKSEEYSPRLIIIRYTADGRVDTDFADDGFFNLESFAPGDSAADDAVLQPDGTLVVVGELKNETLLLRLTPEGQLDARFGTNGLLRYDALGASEQSIVLTDDQKYLVASGSNLVRINQDGTIDDTFLVGQDFNSWSGSPELALLADGKVLVGSSEERRYDDAPLRPQTSPIPVLDIVVRRLNADGRLDSSFGQNGVAVIEVGDFGVPSDLAVQPDGKIVVTGRYGFSVLRLEQGGALDASYTDAFESAEVAMVTPNNEIIVAGHDSSPDKRSFALAKFLPQATETELR